VIVARRNDIPGIAAFAVIVVFLGVNFVAARISNRELPPLWGAALRFLIATALLVVLVVARRLAWPRGRALVGALIALVGAAIVFAGGIQAAVPALAVVAVLGAALCAAASGIVIKAFPRSHPLSTNAVAMAVGAAILLALSFAAREPRHLPALRDTWAAVAWLVTSSIVAFVAMVWLIGRWGATRASYTALVSPLVTAVAALLLTREAITWTLALGGAVVLAGVWVGALAAKPAAGLTGDPGNRP